ncbi:RNA polymerase sigma factor [Indioceanicola profundi]|uniref:RNA polymerase sigma factor n=1 Tax=Indioceanicola profundi TaxID=2220096 RepID=UPI0013C4C5D2|nr:sigma-70 region 4 domain-containing protein [Indioceanicola profundi]
MTDIGYAQIRAVQNALAALPPDLREALVLVTVEGLRYREAADRLNITIAALTRRIARARATLATNLSILPGQVD